MTDVALYQPAKQWELIQRQCSAFLESGFLPVHIKTMAQAVTIAQKGFELGIPPLQAFSSISVIGGKPCLSAELMLALIYSRCRGAKVTFTTPPEKQSLESTVVMQRPDGEPQTFRFSIEDAKRAGIYKNTWEKYPSALLRARATSAGARAVFPDCIMGCYTPEEMGGEVLDVDPIEIEKHGVISQKSEAAQVSVVQVTTPTGNTPSYDKRHEAKMEELCTEPQRKKLYVMTKELGWTEEDAHNWLLERYKVKSSKDLTKKQMSEVFLELNCIFEESFEKPEAK